MKRIFSKDQAMKLEFADAVHVWIDLDKTSKHDNHWNCFIWKIYNTRLDLHGLSKKNWGLTWDTYGITWILSTPINSYDKRNIIKPEDIKSYLETERR